jgi:hypothetical protein
MRGDDVRKILDAVGDESIEVTSRHLVNGRVFEVRTVVCAAETWDADRRRADPAWQAMRCDGIVQAIKFAALGDGPPPPPRYLAERLAPSCN